MLKVAFMANGLLRDHYCSSSKPLQNILSPCLLNCLRPTFLNRHDLGIQTVFTRKAGKSLYQKGQFSDEPFSKYGSGRQLCPSYSKFSSLLAPIFPFHQLPPGVIYQIVFKPAYLHDYYPTPTLHSYATAYFTSISLCAVNISSSAISSSLFFTGSPLAVTQPFFC